MPSGSLRTMETGAVWKEVLSGAAGDLELLPQQTFRVRAAGAVTVTVGGDLAMTMVSGEIAVFNAGYGEAGDSKAKVTVSITGSAFVQVAEVKSPGLRRQ